MRSYLSPAVLLIVTIVASFLLSATPPVNCRPLVSARAVSAVGSAAKRGFTARSFGKSAAEGLLSGAASGSLSGGLAGSLVGAAVGAVVGALTYVFSWLFGGSGALTQAYPATAFD